MIVAIFPTLSVEVTVNECAPTLAVSNSATDREHVSTPDRASEH